jgi:hypothetical protein
VGVRVSFSPTSNVISRLFKDMPLTGITTCTKAES